MNQSRTFVHHKTGKPTTMDTTNIGQSKVSQQPIALNMAPSHCRAQRAPTLVPFNQQPLKTLSLQQPQKLLYC
ncbi:hypothetical protein HYZ98_04870 [Candidatus Peregrinibacteria bacterium]|nr:hypothetical protein [Candidatus Peregrinibacteria bacterium]